MWKFNILILIHWQTLAVNYIAVYCDRSAAAGSGAQLYWSPPWHWSVTWREMCGAARFNAVQFFWSNNKICIRLRLLMLIYSDAGGGVTRGRVKTQFDVRYFAEHTPAPDTRQKAGCSVQMSSSVSGLPNIRIICSHHHAWSHTHRSRIRLHSFCICVLQKYLHLI